MCLPIEPNMAEQASITFLQAYLEDRNKEKAIKLLDDDIEWFGTGCLRLAKNKIQASHALSQDIMLAPTQYQLSFSNSCEQILSQTCAMYTCLMTLSLPDGTAPTTPDIRMTFLCRMTEDGCKIASIFSSVPAALRGIDEPLFGKIAEESPSSYDRRMRIRCTDLANKLISGGIISCYLADQLPFYYANPQAVQYLGYDSPQAFICGMQGYFINCIHPDDQAKVCETILYSLKDSGTCVLRYRIRRQNGSYLWIRHFVKEVRLESGESICLGVFSDISAEAETEEKLLAEQQKAQRLSRLAEINSQLLNIVMAHTSTYVFYYDPIHHQVHIPPRTCEAFHLAERYTDAPYSLADYLVAPDFISAFLSAFERIHHQEQKAIVVFQGKSENTWFRMTLSRVSAACNGNSNLVAGILEDLTRGQPF